MTQLLKLNVLALFSFLFFSSKAAPAAVMVDPPGIKAGVSKITGTIIRPEGHDSDETSVNITVPHPISGEYVRYKAIVDQSGKFSIDVDIETDSAMIGLNTSLNPEKAFLVKVGHAGLTNIDIAYESNGDLKSVGIHPYRNHYDLTQGFDVVNKMIAYRPKRAAQPLYEKSTDYFFNYVKMVLGERLEIVRKDSLLSNELKSILAKDFGLFMYSGHVFDYESEMKLNYRNINNDESGQPDIQKIDRTYYRFLKDMKLNDLEYLQCFSLVEFQMKILQNETIGLPLIEESDIASWIADTKHILGDLLGFKDGPYYDILAANAYARQLNEEVRPLSKKQKEHIARYWKNGEVAKILLRKNLQVEELDKFKTPTIVHDISSVPAEKVLETIVAKHKNKVVLVDLWATWCAPCLDAMQQFRTAKTSFQDKDVAFVYLSNRSSPRKLWEEKIKGIGGEQYYLTDAQWEYVMDHFGFEAIPSYVIYDSAGSLVQKFTGFPGSGTMAGMIDEASKSKELD